jgi:GNAT superfamily N-acetyltransferase
LILIEGDFMENGFKLREATERDIPLLSIHHRKMFEEIWKERGLRFDESVTVQIEEAYARKLRAELPAGFCKSWVIEKETQVVASAAISIVSFVPTPADLSSKIAYLHSVYTDSGERGRSLATRIVQEALEYCRTNGINRMILNASHAGRPIYEKMGFSPSADMMKISVE